MAETLVKLKQQNTLASSFAPRNERTLAERYSAPSSVILGLAEKKGIEFNTYLDKSLSGIYSSGNSTISGFAQATRHLGLAINGVEDSSSLFSSVVELETGNNLEIPEKATLLGLATNENIPKSAKIFFRMVLDTCYPYDSSDDEYIVLNARQGALAISLGSRNGVIIQDDKYKAILCSDTESLFIDYRSEPIIVDGLEVAREKHTGDATAVLEVKATLNGVRLDPGTILVPNWDDDGVVSFGYGRLSLFNFESSVEAALEMPGIVSSSIGSIKNLEGGVYGQSLKPNGSFADLGVKALEALNEKRIGSAEYMEFLVEEIDDTLEESQNRHIVLALKKIDSLALHLSILTVSEQIAEHVLREELLEVRKARLQLIKRFGSDNTTFVEQLLKVRTELVQRLFQLT